VSEKLELNQEVIINDAISNIMGSSTLLKYYAGKTSKEKGR